MEKVLKAGLEAAAGSAGPAAQVVEVQQSVQEVIEPPNNNLRDAGIVIVVLVAAAVCARLYQATSKRK